MKEIIALLRRHGIQATPQRIAIAECVLKADAHPTADAVWEAVKRAHPTVSRATVYNTLHLFCERNMIKSQILKEGIAVFDRNTGPHHHFIDEGTGEIIDIPWESLEVIGEESLQGFEIREYQVVIRGRKKTG
ncbi:MAG: transcriptional repressor [Armatimonadetes bacterium]|nr:transcriptional repressor [Armatimonadota bacterium]